MRKILVTGLTGHLGKNLAKNLNKYFYIYSLQEGHISIIKILKKSNAI